MADLSRAQRRRLLDALTALPALDAAAARDLLLQDLPAGAPRADIKSVDLALIVSAADAWGMLDEGTDALLVLLQNALDFSRGTAQGRELQALYDELSSPVAQLAAP